MEWLGATLSTGGVTFRVWAPERTRVAVEVEAPQARRVPLQPQADGTHSGFVPGIGAGALYRFRLDDDGPFPDPVSRFQPQGVHGPSQVVDPAFAWTDDGWRGLDPEALVLYELHVGCFTPEGTFAAAAKRLPDLAELGVTAVELMPVGDFPGARNWGYDGVSLFAPARCYGTPDDLRRFVDAAHRQGLGVVLDVVYNHFGPDGAYHGQFSPHYYTQRHRTPWGAAINLDDPGAAAVRRFFVLNALHWIHEYHVDGLRLDATHALFDDSRPHFLAELARACRERGRSGVRPLLIAEDHRNLDTLLRAPEAGGFGLDGVWSDDLHHVMRRLLAGDHEGYYRDYSGTTQELAEVVARGWLYCGRHSVHQGGPRGSDPAGIPPRRFVTFVQNHDQVGNRALGTRLHHDVGLPEWRAALALWLCLPHAPLLFMGQEWAASTPFLYFTDHEPELGRRVTAGRRSEFRAFAAFGRAGLEVPDPQAETTFARSRLDWSERLVEPHASCLRLTRALLRLRREGALLAEPAWDGLEAGPLGDDGLWVTQRGDSGERVLLVRFRGAGELAAPARGREPWRPVFSTEDPGLAPDPHPIVAHRDRPAAAFARPGAVLLETDLPGRARFG
jgi:maltooligosyltrehalose trehalohydrolase